MSPLTEPTRIVLRNGWQPMDSDAAAYITAVETADGQALEEPVKIAIDNFVLGCKADGIWNGIKASCILAGARTTNGALVPLKGTAPTPYNFDLVGDTDYNRKTGLKGDGSTKYLKSNRNNNADPQNSRHLSSYISEFPSNGRSIVGYSNQSGATHLDFTTSSTDLNVRVSSSNISTVPVAGQVGFYAVQRYEAANHQWRFGGVTSGAAAASQVPANGNHEVFSNSAINNDRFTNARLAFYSIGESLDLALLDSRVTDLINKFAEVIP